MCVHAESAKYKETEVEALLGLENRSHEYMKILQQASRHTKNNCTPRIIEILVDQISAEAQEHFGIEDSSYGTAFSANTQVIFQISYEQIEDYRSCPGHDWSPCCWPPGGCLYMRLRDQRCDLRQSDMRHGVISPGMECNL